MRFGVADTVAMTGALVSSTLTSKLADATLPAASVAVQLTSVTPVSKNEPELGEHCTATGPSLSSIADASHVATAPFEAVASTTTRSGNDRIGGTSSPAPSVATKASGRVDPAVKGRTGVSHVAQLYPAT